MEIAATALLPKTGRASVGNPDLVKGTAPVRKVVNPCSIVAENFFYAREQPKPLLFLTTYNLARQGKVIKRHTLSHF